MSTITGLTSARMLAIEAASVVSGTISGDDLILTKHDGSTIDAGNVRGPVGPTDLGLTQTTATTNFTAVNGHSYYYNGASALTATLPSATVGSRVRFKLGPGAIGYFNIVRASTNTFEDGTTSFKLSQANGWVELHCGVAGTWSVDASHIPSIDPNASVGKIQVFNATTKNWELQTPKLNVMPKYYVSKHSGIIKHIEYQNGWDTFAEGAGFGRPCAWLDAKGMAHLNGLTYNGTAGVTIFQLPAEYWPPTELLFVVSAGSSSGCVTLVISAAGEISVQGSFHGTGSGVFYIQTDNVSWWPTLSPAVWTNFGTMPNGWVDYGTGRPVGGYYIDIDGICHLQGQMKNGTIPTVVFTMPSGKYPLFHELAMLGASELPGRLDIDDATGQLQITGYSTGGANVWVSLNGICFPTVLCSVDIMIASLLNGWSMYGSPWPPLYYYKDSANIVRWGGLMAGGPPSVSVCQPILKGWFPQHQQVAITNSNDQFVRVDIMVDGTLWVQGYGAGGSNAWVSLTGLHHAAEA